MGTGRISALRIGIDIRGAQEPHSVERGIGRYIFDLIDGLSRFGSQHEYVLLAQPDLPVSSRFDSLPDCCRTVVVPTQHLQHLSPLGGEQNIDKLRPVWALRCRTNQRQNAQALAQCIRQERLDALHLTDNFVQTYFTNGRYPCPIVKTFYVATPLVMRDRYLGEWPARVNSVYLRQVAAIGQAQRIVAISRSAAQDAVRLLRVAEDKISVIYPAVHDSFQPIADDARHRICRETYGITRPYFINCSGAGHNKNRDGALRAFARFAAVYPLGKSCQFVLVGPHGSDEEGLKKIAAEEGLTENQFLITGFVPDADLVTLFSGAVALVAPSFYEGFGLPPAQALHVGTPAIVSDRGALPEVVGDGGLLVDPFDICAIAHAMVRLMEEPNLRGELAARGYEHVRQFTSQRQAEAHLDLYDAICEPKSRRRP